MSKNYKENLQTNNVDLRTILDSINNLPALENQVEDLDAELTTQESLISQLSSILDSKASGGSGGGTSTADIILDGAGGTTFQYIDASGALTTAVEPSGTYNLPVPGIYTATGADRNPLSIYIAGSVQQLFNNGSYAVFYVFGDSNIAARSVVGGGA